MVARAHGSRSLDIQPIDSEHSAPQLLKTKPERVVKPSIPKCIDSQRQVEGKIQRWRKHKDRQERR
jgi:hypothetical protein